MLADDSGPVLWDTAQLVPAVFHGKQSLINFSGVDVHTAGRSIFHPRLRFLSHISQKGDWGAPIHHSQTYLRADNSAERKVLCFSKPTHSHRILVDALLRWPSHCLNGFQAVMWNDSFEKGTHSNEDKVIKLQQLSLDLCFFLDCRWWECVPHMFQGKDTRERMMFILSALVLRGVFLYYCLRTVSCQFSHFLPLSIGINQFDSYRWVYIDFEYGYFKDILHAYTFSPMHTWTHICKTHF